MKALALIFLSFVFSCCAEDFEDAYFKTNGGMVQLKGKGSLVVLDCREDNGNINYEQAIAKLKDTFNISVGKEIGIRFSFQTARNQIVAAGANVAVFIVDDSRLPMTLCASEENWALINVNKLRGDNPSPKNLEKRLNVLIVRQACRALGSDETKAENCTFHTIQKPKDLDVIDSLDVTINPYMSIVEVLPLRGIEAYEYGTYRDACESGVAKDPTNDVQRAIWREVHSAPQNPIKIKFDPKKGR